MLCANVLGLIKFVQRLRDLSGGKPVGFKLCVGHPAEIASVVQAMLKLDITPGMHSFNA
jgi:glutamate synthase domain-containing protein 2